VVNTTFPAYLGNTRRSEYIFRESYANISGRIDRFGAPLITYLDNTEAIPHTFEEFDSKIRMFDEDKAGTYPAKQGMDSPTCVEREDEEAGVSTERNLQWRQRKADENIKER